MQAAGEQPLQQLLERLWLQSADCVLTAALLLLAADNPVALCLSLQHSRQPLRQP